MNVQDNVPVGQGWQAENKAQGLRAAANSLFYRLIDEQDKKQVLAAVRECAQGRANVAQHKKLLAEQVRLIPSFTVFRMLVQEDLRAAYIEDREHKTRTAKLRRLTWLTLFKHFAKWQHIDQALEIRALDHSGNYACELVDKELPDQWDKLVKLAASFGITETQLIADCQETQAKRA